MLKIFRNRKINNLKASGGTNIYSGLSMAFGLLTKDFLTDEKIISMILLSDGYDLYKNADINFKNLVKNSKIPFTLHTFGYGESHDAELLYKISLIKDGGYFFIRYLVNVQDYLLEIYGSLSTVYKLNAELIIQSNYSINKVYGMEDMYEASLTNSSPYTFKVKLIHFLYGKIYNYVVLVNIPADTPFGTEVLKATIIPFNQKASYYWDLTTTNSAYEEYIRGITSTYFQRAFDTFKQSSLIKGKTILQNGKVWISKNYDGKRASYDGIKDWGDEFEEALDDFNHFEGYGKPNFLSKLRELKTLKLGSNYNDENSYQRKIIDDSYNIDVTGYYSSKITGDKIVNIEENKNYYYFYLKDGKGEINNLHFSEERSSIIIYTENKTDKIKISSNGYLEYYSWSEKVTRLQTKIDFSRGGKFIYKRDFPFDFYTKIDGKRDITFNIQFLDLEYTKVEETPNPIHYFEIIAYILNELEINSLKNSPNILPSKTKYIGYYDKSFRIGKFVIKKDIIYKQLSSNYNNYLYIIIQKGQDIMIDYTKVIGQFSFIPMDYIYSVIPENYYIYSNLFPNEEGLHLYKLKMEPILSKKIRIEFATSGSELDCKVLTYQVYSPSSEEFYFDSKDLNIQRTVYMGKTYIDISQANDEESKFKFLILSIFSTNGENIAGQEETKLCYTLRYSTYSDYGIYSFNDIYNTGGAVEFERNEEDHRNITINFYPLQSKKIDDDTYIPQNTRFALKVYPINKNKQKIYESISLFPDNEPELFMEKDINFQEIKGYFDFQIDTNKNYFITLFTVSNNNYEILSYKNIKIPLVLKDIIIDDDNSFENEFNEEMVTNIQILDNITQNYLEIKISDFDEGEYGTLYAYVDDKVYKSVQPSNNIIIIKAEKCQGKNITLEIKLKNGKKIEYFLSIKLVDKIQINPGENLVFEMLEEYNGIMEIIINKLNNNANLLNIFTQSQTGDFTINGYGLKFGKSESFGAQSTNILQDSPILIEISSKTGEFIYVYTHIVKNSKKRIISDHEISLYGYLEGADLVDCIYFNDQISEFEKYQIRILGDKEISIKYNKDTTFDYTENDILYIKEFSKNKLEKICLKQKNNLESVFFNMQIIDISHQTISSVILQSTIFGAFYVDKLSQNEIRYYRQGLFDSEKKNDLRYLYNIRQIKGEIKVYITECDNFPYCKYTKEDLEKNNNNKYKSLYNINEFFIFSKKSTRLGKYDPEKIPVYIILCLSDYCEYAFILNKNTDYINLKKMEKFSNIIYKNNIDKFTIIPKDEDVDNVEIVSITLYTHTGEVMLSTNDHCNEIKHIIFGHMEKLEIPKSCNIKHLFEIYVQANIDSVYSLQYQEIKDMKYTNIKSNIIHMVNIYKEKLIEFMPDKNSYFIKFIPINCDISIKYGENNSKLIPSQQNIFYYNSDDETDKYYNFTIYTEAEDCIIYTYLEELTDNFYGILSDQVPYYISLNKNNKNYKLIYPLPNSKYAPKFKINFFEETPIKIIQRVDNYTNEEEINAVFMKDIKPNVNILEKCEKEENDLCYFTLEIIYNIELENPIILEVIPKSSNEIPGILMDNKIKQDFVSLEGNSGQQYMSKILKDEEGEIYFNYKYFPGELIGKIINSEKKSWKNRYDLPEKDEYLPYDSLKQKIIFTKKETNRCYNGCYLFIEVHNIETFKKQDDYNGLNMDYSIILKKYNDNIVKLRLNEVIIGTLTNTIDDNYIEYYSIQIPYSTTNIYIDYSSENTNIIINSGNIKPSIEKSEYSFESTGKDQIYIINSGNRDLKGNNYIIGIYTKKLNNGIAQYNLRIRVENKIIKKYIYSDVMTENICETKQDNEICYFLIPIINKQERANLFLYAISTSNSDDLVISYKKIKIYGNLIDGEYIDDNIYNISSKDEFIKNMLYIPNSELNLISEDENILIKIEIPLKGIVTLLHTFKTNLEESLLNPKNKILYSLNPNEIFYLNIPNGAKSLVHINVINGKARIGYENDDNSIQEISGKYSSMYLQGIENNDNKKIIIKTDSENSFYFYTYIKIGSIKRNINDIGLGSGKLRTGEGFPLEFYSKISKNNDYTINFNINNIKEIEENNTGLSTFNIKGYIVSEEIIEKLKLDDTMVYSGDPIEGKYETGFGIAKLVLSSEDIEKYYIENKKNYIYLIIEDSYANPSILNDIIGEITILQNNNLDYVTPDNTYINGNLPKQNSTNKYKLIKKNSKDKKIRVEFSSSSENVKYKIYYDNNNEENLLNTTQIDYEAKKNLGKENIDITLEDNYDSFIFEIYSNTMETDINKLSYTLRYRTDEGKKVFKNYKIEGTTIVKAEIIDKDNIINATVTIPSIQDNDTLEFISSAIYYLKIYKFSENDLLINNTISIVDGIKPYKTYEFKINESQVNKNIEIPHDDNKYYISISAITSDKELLSYKSFYIDVKKDEDDNKIWIIILIILLVFNSYNFVGNYYSLSFEKKKKSNRRY